MLNKKGGIAAEEIPGLILVLIVLPIGMILLHSCGALASINKHNEVKKSISESNAIKSLNVFLEMAVDNEKDVADLIVESYQKNDFDEVDKLAEEYFSSQSTWRLIVQKDDNIFYDSIETSSTGTATLLGQSTIKLPVARGEDIEFLEITLQFLKFGDTNV